MDIETLEILLCFQSVCFVISILLLIRAQGQTLSTCREIRTLFSGLIGKTAICIDNSASEKEEGGTENRHSSTDLTGWE